MSVADKLQQLSDLYDAGRAFGWAGQQAGDDLEVYERWRLLRERLHG